MGRAHRSIACGLVPVDLSRLPFPTRDLPTPACIGCPNLRLRSDRGTYHCHQLNAKHGVFVNPPDTPVGKIETTEDIAVDGGTIAEGTVLTVVKPGDSGAGWWVRASLHLGSHSRAVFYVSSTKGRPAT